MNVKHFVLLTVLSGILSACENTSNAKRELIPLPEPDKDLRQKYEKKQDSIQQLQGTKIPTH